MKLAYHHRVRSKDGQYVHVAELIEALRRRGHEVVLVEPGGTREAAFGDGAGLVAGLKRALPKAAYELLELAYGLVAGLRLLYVCWRVRPDIVYERYNLHLPAGAIVRRLLGIPLLLEVNAPLAEERARHDGLGLPRLAERVEGLVWRGCDRVLVVSGPLARRVGDAGVPPDRIAIVPNGIDPARFAGAPDPAEAKRRLGLEGRTVLGFVGFVRAWHGLDRVLDWMAGPRRDDVVLLLVGDGPARAELEAQAERLGLASRLVCTGIVGRELIRDRLAAFDVALQPAVVDYASPLKLFEYMAMGLAIAAPDSPNIREILTDGHDGLLCGPEGLPAALDRLVGQPELRGRLGANARETLLRRGYTWEANARVVEELAAACIAEAGRRRAQRRLDRLVEPR